MRENKTCPHQRWKHMPTEELDQILQAELEKENPNEEVVLPILYELEEREKDVPVESTPEVLAKINKFKKQEISSIQSIHKRKWLAGVAVAAVAVFFVIMTISPTAKAESLFDVLFRWTSSIFEFINPDKNEVYPNTPNDFTTEHPGLQQLYDKVTELGVTEPVVPMWLPEGFALSELKDGSVPEGTKVFGKFENGGYAILLTYRISTDISPKVEKEDTGFELFEFWKVSHFIVDNEGNMSVTWTVDGVECVINTNLPKGDIYSIIKSIYRSELTK